MCLAGYGHFSYFFRAVKKITKQNKTKQNKIKYEPFIAFTRLRKGMRFQKNKNKNK